MPHRAAFARPRRRAHAAGAAAAAVAMANDYENRRRGKANARKRRRAEGAAAGTNAALRAGSRAQGGGAFFRSQADGAGVVDFDAEQRREDERSSGATNRGGRRKHEKRSRTNKRVREATCYQDLGALLAEAVPALADGKKKRRRGKEGAATKGVMGGAQEPKLPAGVPRLYTDYFKQAGLRRPTEVQRRVWAACAPGLNAARAGRRPTRADVVACAPAGSGKTLAFLLPAVAAIMQRAGCADNAGAPSVLVVGPTRELVAQIAGVASPLARLAGVATVCAHGGADITPQADALAAGVDVLVGTPGRLLDLHRRKALKLGKVQVRALVGDRAWFSRCACAVCLCARARACVRACAGGRALRGM